MKVRIKYPFRVVKGPLAVIRVCEICGHKEVVKVGIPGVGRGYGMREGNKARGRMIQHIKSQHPNFVNFEKEKLRDLAAGLEQ